MSGEGGTWRREAGDSQWTLAQLRKRVAELELEAEELDAKRAELTRALATWTTRLESAELVARGKCRRCGKPIAKGSTSRCEACLAYARKHEKEKNR